ncbi:MAG: 4-hydroxy-tetrahydrodipicolinate synthase [Candidatus Nanohalarchaeota archaeon]|nr:MAG: 4-hydroxy-tetrahydrodipicolinate synthase [Candidatus Nanohaloarchaeota archaeon]
MSKIFSGCYPALVTPLSDGDGLTSPVNQEAMNKLIDYVLKGGVDGILVAGCTGHATSMTWDEQTVLMKNCLEHVNSKTKVIAGDGSNCTREAINAAKKIEDIGITTHLQISPYQNKPMQEGLYQHYAQIASKIDGDIILYNVPGRTAKNIEAETTIRLAKEFSNIIAIKEASGDMAQIKKIIEGTQDLDFSVVSGDDNMNLDIIKAGGTGGISVAANIDPRRTCAVVRLAREGKYDEAHAVDMKLKELYRVLFIETNPQPTHYALRKLGIPVGVPRLPLIDVTDDTKEQIDKVISDLNLKGE